MNNKRNSTIILAKDINMDKEYSNILDYSESAIVELCESNDHLVAKQTNYSFLKIGENQINVGIPYETCLQANYIAMQNPFYSNKWFFAFIDRVEYNSEKSTNIYYTVDEISTWWDYWGKTKKCFVVREHVNDDTVGLHTVDEGLNTGEYICNSSDSVLFNDLAFVIQYAGNTQHPAPYTSTNVNGIISPGTFYVCRDKNDYDTAITAIDANESWQVLNAYVIPSPFLDFSQGGLPLSGNWPGKSAPITTTKSITRQTTLDTHVPKNNKLLCYPYNYILEHNNNGGYNILKYELFTDTTPTFTIGGVSTLGGSIVSTPTNYKGGTETNSLSCGKFPTSAWKSDSYTNWLTQQGINIGGIKLNAKEYGNIMGIGQTGIGIVASLMGAPQMGVPMIGNGIGGIVGTMVNDYEYGKIPDVYYGNTNIGDYITASGKNGFWFYKMSIKKEFAESIDSFFTRFGYKVNIVKTPNFTGRTYWNYVQIGDSEIIGYSNQTISIPESSMDIINAVFRKGTTIWHNHDNIGDFTLDNTIITP